MDDMLGVILAMFLISVLTLSEKTNKPDPNWVACQALVENTPGAVRADFRVCKRFAHINWGK